ncbi:MAG: aminotransferase class V-fold PLP-dependent enzyme [Archangiaceae bacterium]|nr:aminotransferase class V-fold PLP-dependent enzyme [Archangiaceae bacterium]
MSTPWTYKTFVADALTRVKEISCEEAHQKRGPGVVFLDLREADEVGLGTLPGAVALPRGLLEKHVGDHVPDKGTTLYLYCSTGNRSALAGDVLQKMGYANVFNLQGGIERWQHLGLPIDGVPVACAAPGKLTWAQVRGEFPITTRRVPVLGSGERPLVYLDHAASTHPPLSVLRAYTEFMEREYSNVHRGTHLLSRKATERFEEAYYVIADYLGAELKNGCVVFTQNTTHAIDLASHVMQHRPGKVLTTEMEHHSNELPHRARGPVLRARVNGVGELDLNHVEELLRKNDVKLFCVTAGSNVTGIMPPLGQLARLAHDHGALILVDAAQALARIKLDVKPFGHPEHIDFLAGAGHKAYAPFGAGFLYGPRAVLDEAAPYLPGGGTAANVTSHGVEYMKAPDRHHGGTPNIGGVVAMARALQFIENIGRDEVRAHELKLTQQALDGLKRIGGVTVYGPADASARLGVVTFNVDGVSELLTAAVLSEEGALAVRNGRFCSHLYVSRLLEGQVKQTRQDGEAGVQPTGMVRASVGLYNDESDVHRLLEFVDRVKHRKWVGRYRTSGDSVSAAFAGRCADKWMEASIDGDPLLEPVLQDAPGYHFEVLQPDSASRTYLVADLSTGEAALVDPLRERVDSYLDLLSQKKLRLKYTIETHTHADHLSGSPRLKELTGAKMLMHSAATSACVDQQLEDGNLIMVGGVRIEVLHTPGHTNDSICLVLPDRVLTGDTLLIGSCGRTDLPTGNSEKLFESLQRLLSLPDHVLVLPAHDYDGRRASTVGRERKNNHRLKLATRGEFVASMAASQLPKPPGMAEVLQTNQQCS